MTELDCRIIAIFTLALSLVFLGSVIFFRHHQHIHSLTGDDHHRDRVHRSSQEQLSYDEAEEHQIKCLTVSNNPSETHISEVCLQCLCETVSECKPAICRDVPCGLYKISKGYWFDAGEPTLEGTEKQMQDDNGYQQCINNPYCSARTISAYVSRFGQDCNKDGVINCDDIMQLHVQGPTGCRMNKEIDMQFKTRYDSCIQRFLG
ncbi:hypothetical protein ACFFRR_010794 [Megaselia abdita]